MTTEAEVITPDPDCPRCGGTGHRVGTDWVNVVLDPDTGGADADACECMAGPVKP